jgi:hypothetical protein
MTGNGAPATVTAGPGFPRLALGLAWLCASLVIGAATLRRDGPANWALLGLAALGVLAAAAVASNKRKPLTLAFSMATGAAYLVAGPVLLAVLATRDGTGAGDVLLLLAVTSGFGMVTIALTRRSRTMAA